MNKIDMNKVHYDWVMDMVKRIEVILNSPHYTDKDKLTAISWFVKQANKVEREE